jgi:uncharacterized protein YyaL (SSP411 family)
VDRFIDSSSPFLRRAASAEPSIDWWPFGEAAFAEAGRLGRSVFLVIGNSYAHACRVLDDELLADDQVCAALARRCVCVRVDRDASPELDAVYQLYLRQSYLWHPSVGQLDLRERLPVWPLVALLDPAGAVRAAGARLDAASLRALISSDLPPPLELPVLGAAAGDRAALLAHGLAAIRGAFDARDGGFGRPPKAPLAPALDLLGATGHSGDRAMVRRTLDALAEGGIHDQLGGGFHRDSTDERFVVPHFEKRAADQAALLRTFAEAEARYHTGRDREVALGVLAYLEARLLAPGGGVYAAEDADVGPFDDGTYYTFTLDEARAALGPEELAVAQPRWDLYGRGELHLDPTRNVVFVSASFADVARELGSDAGKVRRLAATALAKLRAVRESRTRPLLDMTVYVDQSARVARAELAAARALGLPAVEKRALATLDRLLSDGRTDAGTVCHRLGGAPSTWMADAAELGLLALEAHRLHPAPRHLKAARELADHLLERYRVGSGALAAALQGGPVAALSDAVAPFIDDGGASPSAVAARLFLGLAATGEARYRGAAEALIDALLPHAAQAGAPAAGLLAVAQEL